MVSKTLATSSKTANVGLFSLKFLLTVEETSQRKDVLRLGRNPNYIWQIRKWSPQERWVGTVCCSDGDYCSAAGSNDGLFYYNRATKNFKHFQKRVVTECTEWMHMAHIIAFKLCVYHSGVFIEY